tara:strand:- start:232 stop:525 length:294 start_codon:yes stop_codon:yes gene_type:complete
MIKNDSIYVVTHGQLWEGFKIKEFEYDGHICTVSAARNYIEGYVEALKERGLDGNRNYCQIIDVDGKQLKELLQTLVDLDAPMEETVVFDSAAEEAS